MDNQALKAVPDHRDSLDRPDLLARQELAALLVIPDSLHLRAALDKTDLSAVRVPRELPDQLDQ